MPLSFARSARRLPAVAALLSSLLVAACSSKQDVAALMNDAAAHARKGERNAAIIKLKNVLQEQPRHVEARRQLAALHLKNGDPASAEKEIRRAIDAGLPREQAWTTLGAALVGIGQYQKVLDEMPEGVGGNAEALALRGDALRHLRRDDDARRAYAEALAADRTLPRALSGVAELEAAAGNLATAYELIDRGIAAHADDLPLRLLKARLLRAENRYSDTLAVYADVLARDAKNTDALLGKGYADVALRRFDAAREDIAALRKVAPNMVALSHLQALLAYQEGKPKEALEAVQQVLRSVPDHPPSLLLAALAQRDLGAPAQAEEHLRRYVELVPGNLYAIKQLAGLKMRNGDAKGAAKLAEAALKDAPKDADLLAIAGQANLQGKQFAQATTYFERAAALMPDSGRIQTALGVSRMAQGDQRGAIDTLEKAAKMPESTLETELLLVRSKVAAKKHGEALADLARLQQAHPKHAGLHGMAGQLHLLMQDAKAARAAFERALALDPVFFPAAAGLAALDMKEGDAAKARQRFTALLDKQPGNAQAMLALSEMATRQERADEALSWMEKAQRAQPHDARIANLLAGLLVRTGKSDRALAFAKTFSVEHPDESAALDTLAAVQIARGERDDAIATLSRLANAAADPAPALLRTATLQMQQARHEAAGETLARLLARQPAHAEARYLSGMVKLRQGHADAARALARELRREQPDSVHGHLLEAEAAAAQRQHPAAVSAMEQVVKLQPSAQHMIGLHRAMLAAGQAKEADARAAAWLRANDRDIAVRMYLAERQLQAGAHAEAARHYDAVVERAPRNAVAWNNLALARHALRDERALDAAQKAHALAADNPSILDTLGWLLVQKGDVERGLPMLRRAAELAPGSQEIRNHLAQASAAKPGAATAKTGAEAAKTSAKQ